MIVNCLIGLIIQKQEGIVRDLLDIQKEANFMLEKYIYRKLILRYYSKNKGYFRKSYLQKFSNAERLKQKYEF